MNRGESNRIKNDFYRSSGIDSQIFNEVKKRNLERVLNTISSIYYTGLMSSRKFWQIVRAISNIWKSD